VRATRVNTTSQAVEEGGGFREPCRRVPTEVSLFVFLALATARAASGPTMAQTHKKTNGAAVACVAQTICNGTRRNGTVRTTTRGVRNHHTRRGSPSRNAPALAAPVWDSMVALVAWCGRTR